MRAVGDVESLLRLRLPHFGVAGEIVAMRLFVDLNHSIVCAMSESELVYPEDHPQIQ